MFPKRVLLFSVFLLAGRSISQTPPCASPVVAPITNVTLGNGNTHRGVEFSVGTPQQHFAGFVDGWENLTYVFDGVTNQCHDTPLTDNLASSVCQTLSGGLFDKNASTSWTPVDDYLAFGSSKTLDSQDPHTSDTFGTDTVTIGDGVIIPSSPVGIASKTSYAVYNTLGLGANSSLLNYLSSSKLIDTKTWSYFHGWLPGSAPYGLDGSLIFGGYDKAKIGDSKVTQQVKPRFGCSQGLFVTINDIEMNFKNGTSVSIIPGPREGCVDPSREFISLNSTSFEDFLYYAESTAVNTFDEPESYFQHQGFSTVFEDGVFDGDLTYTLSPNLKITIPNHQLVLPVLGVNDNGEEQVTNSSDRRLMVRNQTAWDFDTLGLVFLTSAYLSVDYDNGNFSLWPSVANTTTDVFSFGSGSCSPASASPAASASSTDAPVSKNGTSAGAIAGGVVGGVVGAALIAAAAFLLWRRRRRQQQQRNQATSGVPFLQDEKKELPAPQYSVKAELHADQHPAQEMPAGVENGWSPGTYEMSGTSRAEMPGVSESSRSRRTSWSK